MQEALRQRMAADMDKLQRRLLARDAAAKKYKDGCRALKAQLEAFETENAQLATQNSALRTRPVREQVQELESEVAQLQRTNADLRANAQKSKQAERDRQEVETNRKEAKRRAAERERELRDLLLRAQDDVAASRGLCARAEEESQKLRDRVREIPTLCRAANFLNALVIVDGIGMCKFISIDGNLHPQLYICIVPHLLCMLYGHGTA